MSKKSEAINAFIAHRDKFDPSKKEADYPWLHHLSDLVSLYIGPESKQYKELIMSGNMITYTVKYYIFHPYNSRTQKNDFDPAIVISAIDGYISYIQLNGVFKDRTSAQNVLGTLDNATFFTVALALISALCFVSYGIGLNNGRAEQSLLNQNKIFSDTIYLPVPVDFKIKNIADSLKKEPTK